MAENPDTFAKTKILDSANEIMGQFTKSGFRSINIFKEEKEFYYKDEADWWQTIWSQGYRGFLERLNEQSLKEFKAKSFKIITALKNEKGIPYNISVLITKVVK